MILRKKTTDSWTEPTQGTAYTVGTSIGLGTVVYNSNGTTFTDTGLAPGTSYDYKFYSENYSYYSAGATATASTATTSATDYFRSKTTGNWGTAASWESSPDNSTWVNSALAPDNAAASVTILNGHTITLAAAASTKSLTINSGGGFASGSYTLTVATGGTLANSGSFDKGTGAVSFSGSGTISGTIALNNVILAGGVDFGSNSTVYGNLTINLGGYVNTHAPYYASGSSLVYNSGTTYGRGTEWSANSGQGYPFHVQISSNTTLDLGANSGTHKNRRCFGNLTVDNGSTFSMNVNAMDSALTVLGNITNNGTITLSQSLGGDLKIQGDIVDNGTFNANNRAVFFNGPNTQHISGTGTFDISYVRINKTNGSVVLGSNLLCEGPAGGNAMEIDGSSSVLDLNGHILTLGKAGVNSTYNSGIGTPGVIKGGSASGIIVQGTGTFGALKFDQSSPGSSNALQNFTIDRTTSGTVSLGSSLTVSGTLTLTNGTFILDANTLTIAGNSPARTSGTLDASNAAATLAFTNSSSITLPVSIFTGNINNLTINGTGGIIFGNTATVAGTLSLTNGLLNIGSNALTLNSTVTPGSGSIISAAGGTVNFAQVSNGQNVPAGTYGNLTFSNFNKTLANSGTIGIAGTFTPGSGTASISGSTIEYNGTSAQVLPSGFTTYNNLSLNNAAGTSCTGSLTVNNLMHVIAGTFTSHSTYKDVQIDNGATLATADNINVSGNWSNAGTFTPSSYKVTFNGSSQQTISGSATSTFNSVDLNNSNGLKLTGSASIAGTLSMLTGSLISDGGTLSYGNNGILLFNGAGYSATTNVEFPATNGPKSFTINTVDPAGLSLHASRTLSGALTVASGQKFIIPYSKSLTVSNGFTNSGTVTLTSPTNSGPSGSLIVDGTISGNINAERYINGYTSNTDGWHTISSPVNNMAIAGSNLQPGTPDDLFKYNEVTNMWLNYMVGSQFTNFANGEGFLCAYQTTAVKKFTGVPNNSDITFTNLSFTANRGWHLLGNPYPSAVKWNDGNWAFSNINGIAKIFNSGGSYSDINPNGIIPSMQGFFVQVTNGSNSIKIPKASRVHDLTNFYKETETFSETLKLTAQSDIDNTFVETVVRFDPSSTPSFDNDFDAHFLPGISQAPQMYTVLNGNDYLSTNVFPPSSLVAVPMNFVKGTSGNYTLTAIGTETFSAGVTILLEDLKTGNTQNLMTNPVYPFTSLASDNPNRFKLHFSGALGVNNQYGGKEPIKVYTAGQDIYINNSGNENLSALITVYNLLGQIVTERNLNGEQLSKITLNGAEGYYLVKVVTGNQTMTAKIFVR